MDYCNIMHCVSISFYFLVYTMAYGSTPYVANKNGGHIKSAQMTRLKYLC